MDVVKHFRLTHDPFRAERDALDGPMLTHEEARRYVATRVGVAGHADLFSPAALDLLATASRGRPAALRLLASNAMFHAAFDGARRVEETHARQAATTQDIWRDVPIPAEAPAAASVAVAPGVAPVAEAPRPPASVVVPAAAVAAAASIDMDEADGEPLARRHGWWRSAPPLARLAIVVGLLLLSLPVIGYVVGAVKDDRPAPESSYLPDEGEIADAEAPVDAVPELPPAVAPAPVVVAEGRPPVDLTAQTTIADQPAAPTVEPPAAEPSAAEPPVAVGAGAAEPAEAAPAVEQPAPAPTPPSLSAAPRVFVHYSTAKAGGAEAAADVARRLRDQGFDVVDIRAVPVSIETASVRYFFPADRSNAEALHDALGVVLRPRGFSAGDLKSMTGYEPPPRHGTLEVWVPAG